MTYPYGYLLYESKGMKTMLRERLQKSNPDIARHVQKKDKKICIRFALWTVLLLVFYFSVVYAEILRSKGLFWALLMVLIIPAGVFVSVGGFQLLDPAFEGRITKVKFSIRMEVASQGRASVNGYGSAKGGMRARQVNYVKLFVEDEKGRVHRYAMQLPDNRVELGYKAGERVRKYHGLPYPILLSDPVSICPICGSANHKTDPYCFDCGYSILQNP